MSNSASTNLHKALTTYNYHFMPRQTPSRGEFLIPAVVFKASPSLSGVSECTLHAINGYKTFSFKVAERLLTTRRKVGRKRLSIRAYICCSVPYLHNTQTKGEWIHSNSFLLLTHSLTFSLCLHTYTRMYVALSKELTEWRRTIFPVFIHFGISISSLPSTSR